MKILIVLFNLIALTAFAKSPVIEEMITTYDQNQARFHARFRGAEISSTGVVLSIKTDFMGVGNRFFVNLDVGGSKVSCSTTNRDVAASLNKGSKIKFKGTIHDVIFESLNINDCQFTKNEEKGILKDKIGEKNQESTNYKHIKIGDVRFFRSRMYCRGSVTEISGLDTINAKIVIRESIKDVSHNCSEIPKFGDELVACIKENKNKLARLELRANCEMREINIGKNYGGVRFLGINQSLSEFSNNKYLFVRLNDGSVLDGSMASAYDEYLKAYSDLCPSSAPKNK
jgi:hypothetical protein